MEEGDMRVWIHCKNSAGTGKIMAYGSTPYVGMAPPKKMAATLKVRK